MRPGPRSTRSFILGVVLGSGPSQKVIKNAGDLVKLERDTPHIFATGSDHYIQVHQPDLVIQSIRLVIERTKQGK